MAYNSHGLNPAHSSSVSEGRFVSLRITGQEEDLVIRSTAGLREVPAEEFGVGTSLVDAVPFTDDTDVFHVRLEDAREKTQQDVLVALFWAMFGVVVAALVSLVMSPELSTRRR